MVFSPGMSAARTMAYWDQGMWGAKVMVRMRPRAMVERMVQPCHMAGEGEVVDVLGGAQDLGAAFLAEGRGAEDGSVDMGVRWDIDLGARGLKRVSCY